MNVRDVTLGDVVDVIESIDVGALTPEQGSALFRIARAAVHKVREALPDDAPIYRVILLGTAEHGLTELEHAWLRAAGVRT